MSATNLKRLVVLAAVLIPAALIGYRLSARWWVGRPRVYPEAYAEAVKLAEREFAFQVQDRRRWETCGTARPVASVSRAVVQ